MSTFDKLYIKTYGCQMNEYDSERIADLMGEAYGLSLVGAPDDADVILVNTCSVREKAEEKVYSELGRYKTLKRRRPGLVIGVGGCVAQQEGARIQKRAPHVDIVIGPQTYHRLPELVDEVRRERAPRAVTEMPEIEKFDHLPGRGAQGVVAQVTIMEGCDNFCTFCVVPYTRGAEISRPVESVLAECRQLLDAGAVEINLLGQNVNGYRAPGPDGEEWDFTMLVYAVAGLEGLERLRFTTSHPLEMTDDLARAFGELPQLMPYLHLPVQSGSDHILRAMHRGHTRDDYLRTIETLRHFAPELALSSDFIVGYPGESDADFEQTLSIVREVGFDTAFCFKYSPRPGTPAAELDETVPEPVKDERLQTLLALMREQARAALDRQVERTVDVLVEREGRNPGDLEGRTPDFKIVHLRGNPRLVGHVVPTRITAAYGQSLRGDAVLHDADDA